MNDDYVNKQIVCPTCSGRDILYIDLNEIKGDPRAATGTVVRSFQHDDHLLLLDIDHQGDIRTINKIDSKQKLSINQEKYIKVAKLQKDCPNMLIISEDHHFNLLFQQLIAEQEIESKYSIETTEDSVFLKVENDHVFWIKHQNFTQVPHHQWDVIVIELSPDDPFVENTDLLDLIRATTNIACNSIYVLNLLEQITDDKDIFLI